MFILCWTSPPRNNNNNDDGDDTGISFTHAWEDHANSVFDDEDSGGGGGGDDVFIPLEKKEEDILIPPLEPLPDRVVTWRKNVWRHTNFYPPYFSPSFFHSPLSFTLDPMEEIMIVFDRNDELTAVDTCDCACNAGQLTPRMAPDSRISWMLN